MLFRWDRRLAPEEAMFRDAARIGQIPAGGAGHPDSAAMAEALSLFDRAGAIRVARASAGRLAATPLSSVAVEAENALATEDAQRLRDLSLALKDAGGAGRALAEESSCALALAAIVIDGATHNAAATETAS
jgi:hypothetical protein